MRLPRIPTEPEWLQHVREDTPIRSCDMMEIFGYKTAALVNQAVTKGRFPPPDIPGGDGPLAKSKWYAKTVRAEIARRNKIRGVTP